MAVLLLLGGINVFSASLYDNGLSYLLRYYLCAVLGFVGIYFIRKIGYKRLLNKRFLWICYCIVLVMLVVVHFGEQPIRVLHAGFISVLFLSSRQR